MLRPERLVTIAGVSTAHSYPTPRPPLLGRLPAPVWLAINLGAAVLFAALVYSTMTPDLSPIFVSPRWFVPLGPVGQVALTAVVAAPVVLARRAPVWTLAVMLSFSVLAGFFAQRAWPTQLAAGLLVGLLAATRSRRVSVSAALITLAVWLAEWPATSPWHTVDYGKVPTVVLAVAVVWVIGNSIRQRRDYTEAVRVQAAASAVIAERLRIARELHDVVGHSIGIIAIQAGVGNRVIDTQPGEARNALRAIELTSRDTLSGLRRMLVALRRADTDPAGTDPAPGLADVAQLAATTTQTGVRVDVHWRGTPTSLPPDIDLSAFRIIQEAVTNVVRHSTARQCQVCVDYRDTEVAIEVLDDGAARHGAAATAGAGYGIVGMRERVGLLRGRFSAGPRPEGGFRVSAELPR